MYTFKGVLMPGRSVNVSAKSIINALLFDWRYLSFKVLSETFFTYKFLGYSVPGCQFRHSNRLGQSIPSLCVCIWSEEFLSGQGEIMTA